jgi:hypothetical protein
MNRLEAASIKSGLEANGMVGVRADDTQHHDELFLNVLTSLRGGRCGVAVFERLIKDEFKGSDAFCAADRHPTHSIPAELTRWLRDKGVAG